MTVDIGGGNVADGPDFRTLLAEAQAAGVDRLDAELLIARVNEVSRASVVAHGERRTTPAQAATLRERFARRAAGEPLAYIHGVREFWSLDLAVTPDVLVPRPETELLVETALSRLSKGTIDIADLGTGSGAIAIALAHERPLWRIVATDASPAALGIAAANADRLAPGRIEFLAGRWFEPLGGRRFDALLSNPPYIADADPALAALGHEPRGALVAPDQGFADLLLLVRESPAFLSPGGWLLLEHGSTQAPRLGAALVTRGFTRVGCLPDLAGHDRITVAQWPARN
ncbi:MAG: peptide chain release factor N(5)-glutamine methyltransferase [Steroidobacteraceae bacterium]